MKNAEINKSRRWNRFAKLNADDYYCTTSLAMFCCCNRWHKKPEDCALWKAPSDVGEIKC